MQEMSASAVLAYSVGSCRRSCRACNVLTHADYQRLVDAVKG